MHKEAKEILSLILVIPTVMLLSLQCLVELVVRKYIFNIEFNNAKYQKMKKIKFLIKLKILYEKSYFLRRLLEVP